MRRLASSLLYTRYLRGGVTHSHLPALLIKGHGEMAMDNSLRAPVKNKLILLMAVIISNLVS